MQAEEMRRTLSEYRSEKAKENLAASKLLYENKMFLESINRSYYAIFHSVRSLTAFFDFDAKKHSSIISYFNRNFIKTGKIEKKFSKILTKAFKIRNDSDYEDFYFVTENEVIEQIENAEIFIKRIEEYIEKEIKSS